MFLQVLLYRFSPFLMACYNPETEEFQSVCRVMSGFTDEFYKEVWDNHHSNVSLDELI
jgi:ATP-dependent DNA ligase